ncbi:MAG: nitroreductase [Crenarchaeota archaeon]|nr:MAG: nitroreductase [Thermoproteota archaeon]RDJ33794.1 MAG: nitroreductase [Thermoproteota archaeon]RDJ37097.1 MAG: nitroreductase [Thermoproteota archaeon]RDJ37369.1 MAG: nitroreductase [Thermoproteota archaeon]
MAEFTKVEEPYTSKDGVRLVWQGIDEDDSDVVILGKDELDSLLEILSKEKTGKVELEDEFSSILVNSDVSQFRLKDERYLEADTKLLREKLLEYMKIPHEVQSIDVKSNEFYPTSEKSSESKKVESKKQSLLSAILGSQEKKISESEYFRIISTRRSTRKFDKSHLVEDWKVDKILAAADTAPSAGNFQGFEVFYIKNKKIKQALVEAANRQPYVDAPIVLVFCMNPSRVKMDFPPETLSKFSLQDATLAAAYAQLAASALELSSIWIGMLDEEKVKKILGTDLQPSSILCIGYPDKRRPPKSRRKLRDLIHVLES